MGGKEGLTNQTLIERNGKQETLPGKFSHLLVKPGETVIFLTGGGGGWGDPSQRDQSALKRDVELEYVSAKAASDTYSCRIQRS